MTFGQPPTKLDLCWLGRGCVVSSAGMSRLVFLFALAPLAHCLVQIFNHQIESSSLSSSSSSPSFFSRESLFHKNQSPLPHGSRQLRSRNSYGTYYPADITETFVKNNRCPYPPKVSREIPGVEIFDDLFSQVLRYYDDGKHLHFKSKFMGIRMGQFPFDLQVITEVFLFPSPRLSFLIHPLSSHPIVDSYWTLYLAIDLV